MAEPVTGEVDLDWRSVLWVMAGFVGLVALTTLVQSAPRALTILTVGSLIALALDPLVSRITRRLRGHRATAVAAVLIAMLVLVVVAVAALVPPAVRQARALGGDTDRVVNQLQKLPVVGANLARAGTADSLRRTIKDLPRRLEGDDTPIIRAARSLADGVLVAVLILMVAVSLLLDGERLVRAVRRLVPPDRRAQADRLGRLAYVTVGRYVAGSLLVAAVAGVAVLAAGLALRVPLTPLLAVWVALFDLVPQIGGAAGGIPFVLLGFTRSATTGVACAVFFILYLQFENHVLSPLIVGRSVKLSPPATMTAALIGVSAGGVVGALVAVPVVASVKGAYLQLRPLPEEPPEAVEPPTAPASPAGGSSGSRRARAPAPEGRAGPRRRPGRRKPRPGRPAAPAARRGRRSGGRRRGW